MSKSETILVTLRLNSVCNCVFFVVVYLFFFLPAEVFHFIFKKIYGISHIISIFLDSFENSVYLAILGPQSSIKMITQSRETALPLRTNPTSFTHNTAY